MATPVGHGLMGLAVARVAQGDGPDRGQDCERDQPAGGGGRCEAVALEKEPRTVKQGGAPRSDRQALYESLGYERDSGFFHYSLELSPGDD